MNIGEQIKKAREEKGLSQRQLAKIAGTNSSGLSKIEAGEREPSLKILKKICRYMDLNYNELVFELGMGCKINPQNKLIQDYYNNLDFELIKETYQTYKNRYEMALNQLDFLNKQYDTCKTKEETELLIDTIKMVEYDNKTNKYIVDLLSEKIINSFLEKS